MASKFGIWWQKSRLRSWWMKIKSGLHWLWQKMRQHPFIITGIIVILIALTAFIFLVHMFGWDWTGFNGGYRKTTTTSTAHGITTATEQPLTRTLWDWLQLLIVPFILAIGGFWLNQLQKSREQRITEQRNKTEREIALDNQQEQTLREYINSMSELLLDKGLRKSAEDDEVRKIARVRTLMVLLRLNAKRKGRVLQFLYESGLIDKGKHIVALEGANLRKAYLVFANLTGADLHGTNLKKAKLNVASLSAADLSHAYLSGINLFRANLNKASLCDADLQGADLHKAELVEADLSRAFLIGANLQEANLSRANLQEAHLSHEVEMKNEEGRLLFLRIVANSGWLQGANLVEANLSGANLHGTGLHGVNLSGVNLSGADLSRANLKGVTGITVEELEKQANSLKGTTMPNGEIHS